MRPRAAWGVLALFITVNGCAGDPHTSVVAHRPATSPSRESLRTMTCDALIDQLVHISSADYGVQTNILNTPGNPTENQDALLPLGDSGPRSSAVMDELAARGYDAVPALVRHIDDARLTRFTVTDRNVAAFMFKNEYDYNQRTTSPPGVNLEHQGEELSDAAPSSHTLTVGDACFKVLGQIVNRSYDPVRYQPTACLYINSPTASPELARAIRNEWASLTREQHKQRLIQDLSRPDTRYREEGAAEALARYYPEAAEDPILRRLQLPCYSVFVVSSCMQQFRNTDDPTRWRRICEDFVKEHGTAYRQGLILCLIEDVSFADDKPSYMARIKAAFPDVDPTKPYYVDVHESCAFADLIELLPLHSPRIDAQLYAIYREARALPDAGGEYVAMACIRQLAGRGHDAEFLAYCRQRLPEAVDKEGVEGAMRRLGAPATRPASGGPGREGSRQ